MEDRLRKNARNLIPVVTSVLILIGIIYFFGARPNQQLNEAKENLQTKDFIELKSGVRVGLAQALGGAILLIGLFFTWRNIEATEKNLHIAQENTRATQETAAKNIALALEGQITERFTKAIELLGNKESVASRLGGIYALERIAKDSERDHWTIMEILTAYIRENSPWEDAEVTIPETVDGMLKDFRPPLTDVQACLDVVGRRNRGLEVKGQQLHLLRVDLRRYQLKKAHLENANISHSRLDWTNLIGAHLEGAFLVRSHFQRAFLLGSHFEGANLQDVHFENAGLLYAHFDKSKLDGAHFDGADFVDTHFEGVDLSGAKGLTQAQIDLASVDEHTMFPEGLSKPKDN